MSVPNHSSKKAQREAADEDHNSNYDCIQTHKNYLHNSSTFFHVFSFNTQTNVDINKKTDTYGKHSFHLLSSSSCLYIGGINTAPPSPQQTSTTKH